jgi:hypothetical protein
MTARYAIYFAPARESLLWARAQAWLAQPDLEPLTVSARRYGFHATLFAPMRLAFDFSSFAAGLSEFADDRAPVALTGLAPRLIDGFLALTTEPQPQALTDFATDVVMSFDWARELLTLDERARRLKAPLTDRQIELVDRYGYPYVLEQFLFHMTLTDRLAPELREPMMARAVEWFAPALAEPVQLDRLVVFAEPEPVAPFERLDPDYLLRGA